jgi:hypothetical protein
MHGAVRVRVGSMVDAAQTPASVLSMERSVGLFVGMFVPGVEASAAGRAAVLPGI